MTKGHKRHIFIYGLVRLAVCPVVCRMFGYRGEPAPEADGPCLVLANHNTDYDMILLASSFKKQMYFVASEHIMRWGTLSRIINWCFAPIFRIKATTDSAAAFSILRTLGAGENVCLFAEGDRSFAGRTGVIHPTVGKLAKVSRATLITYRFRGLYLSSPRWSSHIRRGKSGGNCVNVYTPDMLKKMSPAEIYEAVERDLYEDAYERQEREMTPFRGKKLAEELETAIYVCPRCKGISTLKSSGNTISCKCGYSAVYDEYGFFSGGSAFRNVTEWDAWQHGALEEYLDLHCGETLFHDDSAELLRIGEEEHSTRHAAQGGISMSDSVLAAGGAAFPISSITQMAMVGRDKLMFTADNKNYQLRSADVCCFRKYMDAFNFLKNRIKV